MLTIDALTKNKGEKKLLDAITMQVPAGQIALLIGSSGAGKSTLLRVLCDLETYDSGSLMLNGQPLDKALIHERHTVGMVFQHFNLFDHLTVLGNVTLALEKVVGKRADEAVAIARSLLAQYGLADKEEHYPASLSGGQKQRLALIRTLVLDPRIVCLDEPTSALDPILTKYVARTIVELAHKGLIVLVASHDINLIRQLPATIYLMRDGAFVEVAPSSEFLSHPERYPQIASFVEGTAPQ